MQLLLIILGALSLLNAIIVPWISNFHMGFVFQGMGAVVLLVYGVFFHYLSRRAHVMVAGVWLVPLIFAGFLGLYGNWHRLTPTEQPSVVIVLGAGLAQDQVSPHLARRLDRAVQYLLLNPASSVIVAGGLGDTQTVTEASAMAYYLMAHGIQADRILQEDQSRSTEENLLFSQQLLDAYFPSEAKVTVISNNFHLYRVGVLANRMGLDIHLLGAVTPWYNVVANYLREMMAVTNMWLFG